MGLLGEVTTEEYQEAIKPPPPPEPFAKGTKVQVEIVAVTEEKEGPSGAYRNIELRLVNDEGNKRFARKYFGLAAKHRERNIKFLAAFGLDLDAINAMPEGDFTPLVGLVGRGVTGDIETYVGNDGLEKKKTTLWYMELPN